MTSSVNVTSETVGLPNVPYCDLVFNISLPTDSGARTLLTFLRTAEIGSLAANLSSHDASNVAFNLTEYHIPFDHTSHLLPDVSARAASVPCLTSGRLLSPAMQLAQVTDDNESKT